MRAFVAVNLGDAVRDAIEAGIDALGIANPPWRWARRDTWHITIKFLGDIESSQVSSIESAIAAAVAGVGAFQLSLSDFGGFPDLKRPRVLF